MSISKVLALAMRIQSRRKYTKFLESEVEKEGALTYIHSNYIEILVGQRADFVAACKDAKELFENVKISFNQFDYAVQSIISFNFEGTDYDIVYTYYSQKYDAIWHRNKENRIVAFR